MQIGFHVKSVFPRSNFLKDVVKSEIFNVGVNLCAPNIRTASWGERRDSAFAVVDTSSPSNGAPAPGTAGLLFNMRMSFVSDELATSTARDFEAAAKNGTFATGMRFLGDCLGSCQVE